MIVFNLRKRKNSMIHVYGVMEYDGIDGGLVPSWVTAGTLIWKLDSKIDRAPSFKEFVLPRTGNMTHTAVTEEEAMTLTGIDHPLAALDKLRDWVLQGYVE